MTNVEVTAAEIARFAGVGRAAVSNWRRRYESFPKPTGGTDTSPTFDLADIQRWLREQGKLGAHSNYELVWQHLESRAGQQSVAQLLADAGAHLARRSSGRQLDAATRADLDRLTETEEASAVFEHLVDRFVAAASRYLAVTPPQLAALMADIAAQPTGTIFDPACGTGSFLMAAVSATKVAIQPHGQESDSALGELATARLAFRTRSSDIRSGDSLRADAFPDLIADAVLCSPPFNDRNWGFEDLAYDPRWVYGMPPKSESELAWVQHCLAHLRPGGRAVLLMPPAVATRRSGRAIRAELLRRRALRAVIALPAGAAPPLGLPLHVWVLERPTSEGPDSEVLLADTTAGEPARIDELGWSLVRERALNAWQSFTRDPTSVDALAGICTVLPVIDLLDDQVDITPARRLYASSVVDVSQVHDTRSALASLLADLPGLLPDVTPADSDAPHRATTSVGELARSGAVTLRQHVGGLDVREEGNGTPVLTARDVVSGQTPTGHLVSADGLAEGIVLQPGDVVVPTVSPRPVAVVITEGGSILGSNLQLIRPDADLIDPWFLAGCLRSRSSMRASVAASGIRRTDVRRIQVPRLPIEEQRRYGATFRGLAEFEQAIRRSVTLSQDLVQAITDGLTTGTFRPDG